MNLPIPLDMTELELIDNDLIQEMIEFLLLHILDEYNIKFMTKLEIIETFNKYINE